ncbi:MerR family DNA-binding transcriptional regulator [Nonomuraea typhae]|uniref:MerR family DNA-binding transcriptional regulator n=1 Tax=Nonomuraea typhae TaxID=2603600 RepID=UPI001CA5D80D|nr:MerR family DNA-binding transcriptional regulator [Nonomuraea typhae]
MATDDLMTRLLDILGEDGPPPIEVLHELTRPGPVPQPLTIAQVAGLLGITAHTLRYYERAGLVTVARDPGGHRAYDAAAVRRLAFLC